MARFSTIIFLLLSFQSAFATIAMTKEKKSLAGLQQIGILKMKNSWVITMNSNYLSLDKKMAGKFKLTNEKELKDKINLLEKYISKIKKIKSQLERTKSEKRLSSMEYYYNLAGVKIRYEDYLFKKIDKLFSEIMKNAKLEQISGFRVIDRSIELLEKKKVIEKKDLSFFKCREIEGLRACDIDQKGQFFF